MSVLGRDPPGFLLTKDLFHHDKVGEVSIHPSLHGVSGNGFRVLRHLVRVLSRLDRPPELSWIIEYRHLYFFDRFLRLLFLSLRPH